MVIQLAPAGGAAVKLANVHGPGEAPRSARPARVQGV